MQLVGINRNGLQSPVSLMGLEFGWFQYPYNLFESGPLQNNFGRDIGINARGFLVNDRLEWRLGLFRGRGTDPYAPSAVFFGSIIISWTGKKASTIWVVRWVNNGYYL